MLFSTSVTKEGVYHDLQHSHADTNRKKRQQRNLKSREYGKYKRRRKRQHKASNQDRFFRISLNQNPGRNGHHTIGNDEGKREKACDSNTQIKTVNDIRYQRP